PYAACGCPRGGEQEEGDGPASQAERAGSHRRPPSTHGRAKANATCSSVPHTASFSRIAHYLKILTPNRNTGRLSFGRGCGVMSSETKSGIGRGGTHAQGA